jgi:hypothetical protein
MEKMMKLELDEEERMDLEVGLPEISSKEDMEKTKGST